MRTNFELDDELVKQALRTSKFSTKKDVVHEAWKQNVAWLKKKQLLSLGETVTWKGDLQQMRDI